MRLTLVSSLCQPDCPSHFSPLCLLLQNTPCGPCIPQTQNVTDCHRTHTHTGSQRARDRVCCRGERSYPHFHEYLPDISEDLVLLLIISLKSIFKFIQIKRLLFHSIILKKAWPDNYLLDRRTEWLGQHRQRPLQALSTQSPDPAAWGLLALACPAFSRKPGERPGTRRPWGWHLPQGTLRRCAPHMGRLRLAGEWDLIPTLCQFIIHPLLRTFEVSRFENCGKAAVAIDA